MGEDIENLWQTVGKAVRGMRFFCRIMCTPAVLKLFRRDDFEFDSWNHRHAEIRTQDSLSLFEICICPRLSHRQCPIETDHLGISFVISCDPIAVSHPVPRFDFAKANYETIDHCLLATNWDSVFREARNVDEIHENFLAYVKFLIRLHVPEPEKTKLHTPDKILHEAA